MNGEGQTPVDTRSERSGSGAGRRAHRARWTPVEPLPKGTLVAKKYRIEALLGEGGMGAVYQAEHELIGRPVAVKMLRPELAGDPRMAARFAREAQLASRIRSPSVVTIHDFGVAEDGQLYLVMELLHGEVLSAALDARFCLPWQEAARIAMRICEGLQVAHDAKVVHRDLKPENVFITNEGEVKVLDFGIARILPRDESGGDARFITHAGSIVGTPVYMSPEAAGHRPIGPAADYYAVGVMLFEMVTGRPVFDDEQVVILLGAHLTRKPERVREVRPELELPEELDALIDRLLAKDPKARAESAAAIAAELKEILGAQAGRSFPTPVKLTRPREVAKARQSAMSMAVTLAAPLTEEPAPATREPTEQTQVPAEPVEKHRSARWPWVAASAVAGVLALGGIYAYAREPEPRPERIAAPPREEPPPAPIAAPEPPPEPETVELMIVTMDGATIEVDGRAIEGGRVELPRDGAPHEIAVSAEGYTTRTITTTADRDREIVLDLERAARVRARPRRAPEREPPEERPRHIVGEF